MRNTNPEQLQNVQHSSCQLNMLQGTFNSAPMKTSDDTGTTGNHLSHVTNTQSIRTFLLQSVYRQADIPSLQQNINWPSRTDLGGRAN